jgi:myo-inositol 2-dehydrogenase/D-chiro-inositol 1-dehydrogenase
VTLRIGVIGAGVMGADHAINVHRFVSGGDVSIVADIDVSRAKSAAAPLGCRAVDDPEVLISDGEVDAVIIASSDATHATLIRACVAAGKPVLCEKPLTPSLAASAALVREVGEHAELVSLGFMRRFDPGYVALKSAILARTIGRPVLLHSVGRGVSSGPGSTSESSVTNSAVHDLDIVPWLLDSPVVEASWHAPRQAAQVGFADPQLILLRTADGALSIVDIFLNARYGYDIRCEVVGESGSVSLAEPVRIVTDAALTRSAGYAADWRPRFADAYRLELQAWVDTLTGRPAVPMPSLQDGLVASAVADAVIRSMHSAGATATVRVPQP